MNIFVQRLEIREEILQFRGDVVRIFGRVLRASSSRRTAPRLFRTVGISGSLTGFFIHDSPGLIGSRTESRNVVGRRGISAGAHAARELGFKARFVGEIGFGEAAETSTRAPCAPQNEPAGGGQGGKVTLCRWRLRDAPRPIHQVLKKLANIFLRCLIGEVTLCIEAFGCVSDHHLGLIEGKHI
jgi:hypothetical protein